MSILLIMQIAAIVLMFVFGGSINAMSQDVFQFWVQNDVRYNSTYYYGNDAVKYANEIVAQNQIEVSYSLFYFSIILSQYFALLINYFECLRISCLLLCYLD